MSERPIFTYQTRLVLDAAQSAVLDAYAALYGRIERSLFSALRAGGDLNQIKREFMPRFGITARQFNAVRVGLEGKVNSIQARRPELIAELQARIKTAQKTVDKLSLRPKQAAKLHQKKRRLLILQAKLAALQADYKAGTVRLCFGSKRLFRAQFDLAVNGYGSHSEWKADWEKSRSNQFFVLGSGDESAGNQTCQATPQGDGGLALRLRLPDSLAADSKYLQLTGVRFAYGHSTVMAALSSSQRIATHTKDGKQISKRTGTALSYRFVRDAKGWRMLVSCEAAPVQTTATASLGAIGVDINADHLAVSEIDRFGNWIGSRRIDLFTYGKTPDQARALIGDAAVQIVTWAQTSGKPLVLEKLDFAKKKAELEGASPKHARMLSSFACNKVISSIKAAAFRAGVEVVEASPAYTSAIGAVNQAQVKGISVHMGAAVAIARRGLGLSERPPKREATVPVRNGGHVTFGVPVRNRKKHVWLHWGKIRTTLIAAHVAHGRSVVSKGMPAPLSPATRTLGAIRPSAVRSRSANRHEYCSLGVSTQNSPTLTGSEVWVDL